MWKDFVESTYNLMKFLKPKFYNRVTWIVVLAGLGLTTTSLLERILDILFKIKLGVTLTEKSDSYIGIFLVIIGLTYNLLSQKLNQVYSLQTEKTISKDRKEHDRRIFSEADKILSEQHLMHFLDLLATDHSYRSGKIESLFDFVDFSQQEQNQYLNNEINKAVSQLRANIEEVLSFVVTHFFDFPQRQNWDNSDNIRFCMYPDCNLDRSGGVTEEKRQFYEEKTKELINHINQVNKSYTEYRRTIKELLVV